MRVELELIQQIDALNKNIIILNDLINKLIQVNGGTKQNIRKMSSKNKLHQLPINEIKEYFNKLYERWTGGEEEEVISHIESMTLVDLKILLHANNMAKGSLRTKGKIVQEIVERFKERKLLLGGMAVEE